MAIFGKGEGLPNLLKRLRSGGPFVSGELAELTTKIFQHPELDLLANTWLFSHNKKSIREAAAKAASSCPQWERLGEVLLRELPGKESEVRRELAKVVIRLAPDKILPMLPSLVHNKDQANREAALDLISRLNPVVDYLGYLKALLKDEVLTIRQRCVKLLAREADNPTIFMMLRALVHDENDSLRIVVIEALSKRPDPEIIEPFFERLPLESPETRSQIFAALRRLVRERSTQIETKLLPILGDENPDMREIAVKLLREMPDPTETLRVFIQNSAGLVSWVRERSIEAIRQVSDDLVGSLIELLSDEDCNIRVGAMAFAKGATDRRLIPAIETIVRSDLDWWIRSTAIELLSGFQDDNVAKMLIEYLSDPDLKYSVVSALGAIGTPHALETLLACLGDPSRAIRSAALDALAQRPTPQVMEAVRFVALEDSENTISTKATLILEELNALDEATRAGIDAHQTVEVDPAEVDLEMVNEGLNE